jgi:hypothetical protein
MFDLVIWKPLMKKKSIVPKKETSLKHENFGERHLFWSWAILLLCSFLYIFVVDAMLRGDVQNELNEVLLIKQEVQSVAIEVTDKREKLLNIFSEFLKLRMTTEASLIQDTIQTYRTSMATDLLYKLQWTIIELADFSSAISHLQQNMKKRKVIFQAPKEPPNEDNTIFWLILPDDMIPELKSYLDKAIEKLVLHRKISKLDFKNWLNDVNKSFFDRIMGKFNHYSSTSQHNIAKVNVLEQEKRAQLGIYNNVRNAFI